MTATIASEIVGVHPYADKFPMLTDGELDELAESIKTVGLLHPIIVTPDGLILDGRNRLEACNRAQVDATVEVYDGADIAEYVIACNVARRNMTTGARAMSTALVLVADGRRENGRWQRGSVDIQESLNNGAWREALRNAGVVLDFAPDLAPHVVNGDVALDNAYQQAKQIKDSAERDKIMAREQARRERDEAAAEAEANARIIADLSQVNATYVALIEDGTLTPKAAWSAYREDTRKERETEDRARRERADKFSQIARNLMGIGVWGRYDNPIDVMGDFNPDELNPTTLAEYFEPTNLQAARRFIDALIEWSQQ